MITTKYFRPLLFILGVAMLAVSLYLTLHFFALRQQMTTDSTSLCHINSYLNCDAAAASSFSNIFGVPISFFGMIISLLLMVDLFIDNDGFRRNLYPLTAINFGFCILLFLLSIIVVKGLCPFCFLYYVLSGAVFFLLRSQKYQLVWRKKAMASFAVIFVVSGIFMLIWAQSMPPLPENATDHPLMQASEASLPTRHSIYKLADHPSAALQMMIFSDFQCPACKTFAQMIPALTERYKENLNIEYFFFPLDNACNPIMDHPMHPFACMAAEIASCDDANFAQIHDDLFAHQEEFSQAWLDDYAKKRGLFDCAHSPAAKSQVAAMIQAVNPVGIQETPTFIINGKKFTGAHTLEQMQTLMDGMLPKK